MQRKIVNTKKVWSGVYIQSRQKKLHSIPIINKVKSSVLYSIPCVKSYTHSFCRAKLFSSARLNVCNAIFLLSVCTLTSTLANTLLNTSSTYATTSTIGDSTASMTLDTSDVVVSVVPGETGYASKSITVSTNNTESYALTITAPAVLKNESSNSTNPWSYAYGQSGELSAMSYTNFDGNTKELESGIESSGSTKTLAFSSTFAEGLASGHYKAEVILGLTAAPKSTTAKWSNGVDSGIEYMQDITPGTGEGEFCKSSLPNHASITLKDKRDENSYTIVKMADGRCWMTENLKLMGGSTLKEALSASNSDGAPKTNWTMPASSTSGFSSNTASNAYLSGNTGYYTWCAATAGTCDSATAQGANAPSSICPKGWKLPTGNSGGEFEAFANAEGIVNSSAGSTKIRGAPYNFAYTGQMANSSTSNLSGQYGIWWSRTAYDSTSAYRLYLNSSNVSPGTNGASRYFGFAVRCVAEEPKTFTLTYDQNSTGSVTNMPSSQSCTTTSDSCTITLSNEKPQWSGYYLVGWDTAQKTPSCANTAQYSAGSQITLTKDLTLYATWGISGCGSAIKSLSNTANLTNFNT